MRLEVVAFCQKEGGVCESPCWLYINWQIAMIYTCRLYIEFHWNKLTDVALCTCGRFDDVAPCTVPVRLNM